MKNKEVIIFLVIALMVTMPVAYADNFLTGFSFIEDVGNFFGNLFNNIKDVLTKEEVAGVTPERDDPECNRGDRKCGTKNECDKYPCEMLCEFNNQWISTTCEDICNEDTGRCTELGTTLNIEIRGGGDVEIEGLREDGFYEELDELTLIAHPDEGHRFVNWEGEGVPQGREESIQIEITMEENREIIVNFEEIPTYTLITSVNPIEGGSITINPKEDEYEEGIEVTLIPHANNRYIFYRWAEGESSLLPQEDKSITITIDRDREIVAYFTRLIINIDPEESKGRVNRREIENEIELTAIFNENEGYKFKKWTGDVPRGTSEMENPITVSISNSNKELTAHFNETICNDNIDNDGDEEVDCQDIDCNGLHPSEGFVCIRGEIRETLCEDGIDNDKNGLFDSLDPNCGGEGLQITAIDFEDDEFWEHSKISIIDCSYEIIPSTNYRLIGDCMNLTIDGRKMECKEKISQNYEDETKGYVQFKECNVGSESEEMKVIKCRVSEKCNGYPTTNLKSTKEITVNEFNICEKPENQEEVELQKEKGLETFTIFEIEKPNEGNSFEIEDTIEIKTKVKNRFIDENDEQSNIEAEVKAVLVKTSTFEEIVSVTSEEIEIGWTHEKIFNLEIEIPENIEGNDYRIYAKVYREGYEEEICRSKSVGINIAEKDEDDSTECEIDEDNDGYCAENEEDCNDEDPRINPRAIEICNDGIDNNCDGLTDFADRNCRRNDDRRQEEKEDKRQDDDSDGDGLPDWWEYNHFNSLNQGPNDDPDGDGISNIDEFRSNKDPNKPNKKSSLLWLWILLGIVLVGAIVFFVIKLLKQPKKLTHNYSLDSSDQNKIKQFIQKAKAQGMNKQQIKNSLLNAGWKQQDIKKFL